MSEVKRVHNERSEAIELISYMNSVVSKNTWIIKHIGGESTLNTGKKRMFPDLYLFGDTNRTQVLQGWEIKMPDISISNEEFISDAKRKADILDVNSCVIWNFTTCILYCKNDGIWVKKKSWDSCNHIKTRADVETYRKDWEFLAVEVLQDLNDFFLSGDLKSAPLGEILTDTVFQEIIKRNKLLVADFLQSENQKNTRIDAYISNWWKFVEKEYKFDEDDKYSAYSKYILMNWINKLTFANMIKANHNPARLVETITAGIAPSDAENIFEKITAECDFFNIFQRVEYGNLLPQSAWFDMVEYNLFLCENGLSNMPQSAFQDVLENSVTQFKREVNGVFATPKRLAEILVGIGVTNLTLPVIDPCCGTGTIPKEVLRIKEHGLSSIEKAFETTYASDKFPFSLQVSNIAMTTANSINLASLLFKSNAFDLHEGKTFEVVNPKDGSLSKYVVPKFGSVVSNLPFVAFDQEGREESALIDEVLNQVEIRTGITLSRRADLYQALIFKGYDILAENGNMAIITSNSWLGTSAGKSFFNALQWYYDVESVIISGVGKWFDNADVVTTMIVLQKKSAIAKPSGNYSTSFGMILKRLNDLTDQESLEIIRCVKLNTPSENLLTSKKYSNDKISRFIDKNISLNSLFYDMDWLFDVENILCPVTDYFEVFRGMKTGQDPIYYVSKNDVDHEYLGRILKTVKNVGSYTTLPDSYSFVCDKTLEELQELGHTKTIRWINKFKDRLNQSVTNKETFWMNMSGGRLSGSHNIRLFTGMNPERRIFYGLLNEPSQINQRAIGFKPIDANVDVELCHALLNTIIGVFYTEAVGFGKGLGALDNNSDNTSRMFMLDPFKLNSKQISDIKRVFEPIKSRKVLTTTEEHRQEDRNLFEAVVAKCFGYSDKLEAIKSCVAEMQRVRLSVRD